MTDLVDAYQRREVHAAEKILRGTGFLLVTKWTPAKSMTRQPLNHHGRQFHPVVYRRASP